MINLKIGDKRVGLPNQWNELKLRDYEKIYTIIKNGLTDEELTDIEETETDVEKISHKQMERGLKNLKLNREIFCQMTGLDQSTVDKTNHKDIMHALTLMSNFLNEDAQKKYNGKFVEKGFTLKDKTYYFPMEKMTESTFGDFIETSQLDMLSKKQEGGKFSVIAEQMAILCREKGEEYDENKIAKKKRLFADVTMDVVWDFVFFLTGRINIWNKNIQTFLKTETETKTVTQPHIGK